MNDYVKIALIVLLAVVLFMLIRALLPAVKHSLKEMPKWLMVVLIAAVLVAIILLIRSFATSGGTIGGSEGVQDETMQEVQDELPADCIIVRADRIIIEGRISDDNAVRAYAKEHSKAHTKVTVVDDYGLASLVNQVKSVCDEEGADCEITDEGWLEGE